MEKTEAEQMAISVLKQAAATCGVNLNESESNKPKEIRVIESYKHMASQEGRMSKADLQALVSKLPEDANIVWLTIEVEKKVII